VITLRPNQIEAADAVEDAWRAGTMRPLVDSCVGSGKSLTMAELARRGGCVANGRLSSLAHTRELVEQNAGACRALGLQVRHQRRGARRTHLARSGHQRGHPIGLQERASVRPGGEHLHRRVRT
jgi:superfamily II DNA or RNA helicase